MTSRAGWLVLFVAVAVRLGVLFAGPWSHPERVITFDSPRYLNLATNLKQTGTFGLAEEEPARAWMGVFEIRKANGTLPAKNSHGLYPEAFRTPGYPLLIAAASVFDGDPRWVLLLQCLLSALAARGLYGIALALGFAPRAAALAGLFWAIHPGLFTRDMLFLTESPFNSFGLLGLWAAACGPRGWKGWLLAGCLLGFAGMIRPIGTLFLPAAWYFAGRRYEGRKLWLVVLITFCTMAPTIAWSARNAATGNGFRVATVFPLTLYNHLVGYSISEERGQDWILKWEETSDELLVKLKDRVKPGDDVYSVMQKISIEELKARPMVVGRVLLKSWMKLFVAHSLTEFYSLFGHTFQPTNFLAKYILREDVKGPAVSPLEAAVPLVWVGFNGLILVAAGVGFLQMLRHKQRGLLLALLCTSLLFTASTLSQGMERFRTPFLFALILLAVYPWARMKKAERTVA